MTSLEAKSSLDQNAEVQNAGARQCNDHEPQVELSGSDNSEALNRDCDAGFTAENGTCLVLNSSSSDSHKHGKCREKMANDVSLGSLDIEGKFGPKGSIRARQCRPLCAPCIEIEDKPRKFMAMRQTCETHNSEVSENKNFFHANMPQPTARSVPLADKSDRSCVQSGDGADKLVQQKKTSHSREELYEDEERNDQFSTENSTNEKFRTVTSPVNTTENLKQNLKEALEKNDPNSILPRYESEPFQCSRCFVNCTQISHGSNEAFTSSTTSSSGFTIAGESTSALTAPAAGSSTFPSSSSFSSMNSSRTVNSKENCGKESLSKTMVSSEELPIPPNISITLSKPPRINGPMNSNQSFATIAPRGLKKGGNFSTCGEIFRVETQSKVNINSSRYSPTEDRKNKETIPPTSNKKQKISFRLKSKNGSQKSKNTVQRNSSAKKKLVRKLSTITNRVSFDSDSENVWVTDDSTAGSDAEQDELYLRKRRQTILTKCQSDTALNFTKSKDENKSQPLCKVVCAKRSLQSQLSNEVNNAKRPESCFYNDEKIAQDLTSRYGRLGELSVETESTPSDSIGRCRSLESNESSPGKKRSVNENSAGKNEEISAILENPLAKIADTSKNQPLMENSEGKTKPQLQKSIILPRLCSLNPMLSEFNNKKAICGSNKHLMNPTPDDASQTPASVQTKFTSPRSGASVRDLIKKFSSMDNLAFPENFPASKPFRKDMQSKSMLQGLRNNELRRGSLDFKRQCQPKTNAAKSVSCDCDQRLNDNLRIDTKISQPDSPINKMKADRNLKTRSNENSDRDFVPGSLDESYQIQVDAPGTMEKKILGAFEGYEAKPEAVEILHKSHVSDHSSMPSISLPIHEEESLCENVKGYKMFSNSSASFIGDVNNKNEMENGIDYSFINLTTNVKKSPFQKFKESLFGPTYRTTGGLKAKKNISESHDFTKPDFPSSNLEVDDNPKSSRKHTYIQLKSLKTWRDVKRLSLKRKSDSSVPTTEETTKGSTDFHCHDRTSLEIDIEHEGSPNSFSHDVIDASECHTNEQSFQSSIFRSSLKRYSLNSPFGRRQTIPNYLGETNGKPNFNTQVPKQSLLAHFTRSKAQASQKCGKNASGYYATLYRNLLAHGKKSWTPQTIGSREVCSPEEIYSMRRHSVPVVSPEEQLLKDKRLTPSSFYPLTLSPFSPPTAEDAFLDDLKECRPNVLCHNSTVPQLFHLKEMPVPDLGSSYGRSQHHFSTKFPLSNRTTSFEFSSDSGRKETNYDFLKLY